ncbi:MAG: transcription elongation factor GreA [Candidatus Saccharibacteria bacterium]|nr:transcription elongation factor GreA [Candidatus Saccharibacteria bacterium]
MIMDKTYHITAQGKEELEAELQQLKGRRGEVADKIAAARDFGDLSENAEYDTAREEQGLLETRIAEIEEILQNAQLIDAGGSAVVVLGSTVELTADAKVVTYTVVGPVEADPLEGKISNESPIGQALMGKSLGDTVTITTPKGELTYTITALR